MNTNTWSTSISWTDGTTRVDLDDQPTALDAISALREYLESRDMTAIRETRSPDCLSWDVVSIHDGHVVGAAAVAVVE